MQMRKTKVIVTMMISLVMAGVLFGCGKTDKLTQSKGIPSAEMTDAEIALAEEFGIEQEDISFDFSNLVVSTDNGAIDMLTWRSDVVFDGIVTKFSSPPNEYDEECLDTSGEVLCMLSHYAYMLEDSSFLSLYDAYFDGDKDNRVFGKVNITFNYREEPTGGMSVMGIEKDTDLKTIKKIFGKEMEMKNYDDGTEVYTFLISFNGVPAYAYVTWYAEQDCLMNVNITSLSTRTMPQKSGLSALEGFIKE